MFTNGEDWIIAPDVSAAQADLGDSIGEEVEELPPLREMSPTESVTFHLDEGRETKTVAEWVDAYPEGLYCSVNT